MWPGLTASASGPISMVGYSALSQRNETLVLETAVG